MPRVVLQVPLKIQVGVVVALFVAALAALWMTSASVIEREGRRASAKGLLDRAGEALAARGKIVLSHGPSPSPFDYPDPKALGELDRRLAIDATATLRPFQDVEGGYFLPDSKRSIVTAQREGDTIGKGPRSTAGSARPEDDLIEIQVDAAIRKKQYLFVVEVVPSTNSTIAIRTAPIFVEGKVVAATWTMKRLVDPLFLDRSTRGYQLAAGLALGGIAVALLLTVGLMRTVRRQAVERDRLQSDLRRSERLAALGKLLAGVAHEVRNPLAGIRSTVQLWQRGIGPDEESFTDLLAEVDRLEGIVARLLHFSRADSQDYAEGDLNAVLADVARLARGQADDQSVRIELDLDPGLPRVWMAPPALVQVFRNLTTNALHAMPHGGVLRLSTHGDVARGFVEATVSDTGPGLTSDVLAHLFEPFYTTKAGGTGLGLAIAHEIALAHRGELRAGTNEEGQGASFTLRLPIANEATNGETTDARARTDPSGGRR